MAKYTEQEINEALKAHVEDITRNNDGKPKVLGTPLETELISNLMERRESSPLSDSLFKYIVEMRVLLNQTLQQLEEYEDKE